MAAVRGKGPGVVLLPADPWLHVNLDPDLGLKWADPLESIFGEPIEDSLLKLLDQASVDWLMSSTQQMAPGESAAGYVSTAGGRPVEILVLRQSRDFDVYLRSAANRIQTLEGLSYFYRTFLASANAVTFTDMEGTILDANRQFLDLYGYSLREVVGQTHRLIKSGRHEPETYRQLWDNIRKEGGWRGELVNRRKNGEEVTVLVSIAAVLDEHGRAVGYVSSATDITERLNLETELRAKNQELEALNALKNDVLAVTSHDLKSPLGSMVAYANLILEQLGQITEGEMREYLEDIIGSGNRLAEFIDDLLDIGKLESGRIELQLCRLRFDAILRSCISEAMATYAEKRVKINYRVHGTPRPTVADVVKIEQVFRNLLSNAAKFAPSGSEIEVEYRDDGDYLEVSVSDRGPGIPEADLERVFDRYYQVSNSRPRKRAGKGAGLGLAICRGIVELHGGTIWAENRFGAGCRFTFRIPVRSVSGLSAVILDPDGKLRELLKTGLEEQDVEVLHARRLSELRRVYEYERPNVIFVAKAAQGKEVLDFLRSRIVGDEREPIVVLQSQEENSSDRPGWFRTLAAPVLGAEINDLFRECRMRTSSLW